jgi:mono/diheme cytochrome c family protein
MKAIVAILIVGLLPLGAAAQTAGEVRRQPAAGITNADQAAGILAEKCVSCHGPIQKKGRLDLSRRASALEGGESGVVIVPGAPEESLLIDRITDGEMPPKGGLERDQVAVVRAWVLAGAHYPSEPLAPKRAGADWWSLRPIRAVPPPHITGPGAAWVENPIDAFILHKLQASGLSPAQEADSSTMIRRLSFDLLGLPPAPEEVERFVSDRNPRAYEALVDRMLASPRYGERWGRHWLDVVRFGESTGYETNLPRPSAWPFRDYVIRAFNQDTPFPRFVLEQLAGDTLTLEPLDSPVDSSDRQEPYSRTDWMTQAATGFLVGGAHDVVGNQTIEGMLQQRADDLDDMIATTGTTFLGLTIQCARCHDHKFDPITQKDYYSIQAVFAGVSHAERAVAAPDAESRRAEEAALSAELAGIERRLDGTEPLAHPDWSAPARPMVNARRNVERFAAVTARMIRLTIQATNDRTEPCLDEVEVYTAQTREGLRTANVGLATAGARASASSEYPDAAIHKIAHLNEGLVGNSHSWISREPGKGSITIAWPEPVVIERVVWGRDREEVYRDRLATEYDLEAALEPGHWQIVASSRDRIPFNKSGGATTAGASADSFNMPGEERARLSARQAKIRARLAQLGLAMKLYAGTFSEPGPTFLLVRGDPTRRGPEVLPAGVASVVPALAIDHRKPEAQRRAALAGWIADPANPLPARVMVNRLWHYHFGRGLVATPSDFGFGGAAPSHPELLDWLASTYIASGWRLKPIHRLIVTSAAYRQSSRSDAKAEAIDRDNRLLWRKSPRRLEAESIRDAILAASGRLDSRMGGPGYNIWEDNTNYVAIYKPRAELSSGDFRRMVYQFKPRSQPDPTFGAFDCPDAALGAPRRNVSTTALQALNLLNSHFVIQQAALFARRLEMEAGPSPTRQAIRGFNLAFGRSPSPSETTAAISLIQTHGAAVLCRALYNANEFVYVP